MKNFLSKAIGLSGAVCMALLFTIAAYGADGDISEMSWVGMVLDFVKNAGGASSLAIASGVIMLITALFKVPYFRDKLWDKLSFKFKAAIPLVLALIGGILKLDHVTMKAVLAYMAAAGGGAMLAYELLDLVKVTYAANKVVVSVIEFIQGILGKGK